MGSITHKFSFAFVGQPPHCWVRRCLRFPRNVCLFQPSPPNIFFFGLPPRKTSRVSVTPSHILFPFSLFNLRLQGSKHTSFDRFFMLCFPPNQGCESPDNVFLCPLPRSRHSFLVSCFLKAGSAVWFCSPCGVFNACYSISILTFALFFLLFGGSFLNSPGSLPSFSPPPPPPPFFLSTLQSDVWHTSQLYKSREPFFGFPSVQGFFFSY